ncbi:MAG: HAD family hydrolase [Paludibacteraceae bacterium]|nr:HAD family hydrolase [Paludibacteraceae bacterium]
MRYKALFIDIDDTLLDYVPCCREAFDAAMRKLPSDQVPSTKERNDKLFDLFFAISGRLFSEAKHGLHTIAEVMELYPREFVEKMYEGRMYDIRRIEEDTEIFKHAFRAAWGKTCTLVPGARETIETLRARGYRLFAASNSFGHLQRNRLELAGLLPFFEDTYISMDLGYDKPDIRFYEEALRRCGLEPKEVLMIGDSMTTDILGAQAAGLGAIFFSRRGERPEGVITVTSLPEILKYL